MTNPLINYIHRLKQLAAKLVNKNTIGVASSFFAKITGTLMGLLLNLMLARLLGPAGIGIYFLALTVVGIGATVARLGIDMAILRFASIAEDQKDHSTLAALYRKSMGLVVTAGIIVTAITWLITPYLPLGGDKSDELESVLTYMLFALIPLALIRLQGQFFKASGAPGKATFIQAATQPLFMVLAVIGLSWYQETTPLNVAIAYAFTSGLVVLVTTIAWNRRVPGVWRKTGEFDTRLLLRTSLPLLWVASMGLLLNWTDILVLGIWTPPEVVGIYGIVARVAALTMFILMSVNSVTAPRFAALYAQGNMEALQSLAQRSATWMLLAVSPLVLVLLIFPEFILQIFGNDFTDGALLLRILALGQLINVAVGSVGSLLIMTGHEKVIRNNTIFAISINLIGNLALVPVLGAVGAALSTAISLAIQNLILYWKVRKTLNINTLFFIR